MTDFSFQIPILERGRGTNSVAAVLRIINPDDSGFEQIGRHRVVHMPTTRTKASYLVCYGRIGDRFLDLGQFEE